MDFIIGRTITDTFLQRVHLRPGDVAFRYKPSGGHAPQPWKDVTFEDFYGECRDVSFGLMALGVKRGDRVAILSNTRYEWSLCDMAILGAAGVTVPIYPSSTSEDATYILAHSEASVLIIENLRQLRRILENPGGENDSGPGASLPATLEHVVLIEAPSEAELAEAAGLGSLIPMGQLLALGRKEQETSPARFADHLAGAKPKDVLTIAYTSGTSGIPKGAVLTHENLMSVLEDCVETLGHHINPRREIILSFLPFSHILGKVESMAIYAIGWKQAFAEGLDRLMANLQEIRPTILFTVPRTFEKAYQMIRSSAQDSSFVSRQLFHWACAVGADFTAASIGRPGQSQTGRKSAVLALTTRFLLAKSLVFDKVAARFGGRLRFAICGGAPLPQELGEFFRNAGFLILEGYGLTETCAPVTLNAPERVRFGSVGRPLPDVNLKIAEDGEILIRSKKVFREYYKMPQETAEAFSNGWFRSGDIGEVDSDGYLRITDRKKDLIVTSGGKKVAPQKIENLVKTHKLIDQFVVHGDRRNYLTALLTLDREQIIRYASENHILFSEYKELVKNPRVIMMVQRIIDAINKRLASFETIKKFVILPNEFTIDSGELTPSLKIRRQTISEKYRDILDSMYRDKPGRTHRA